jgi:aspartate/methionine/tyrosine aminotransferase
MKRLASIREHAARDAAAARWKIPEYQESFMSSTVEKNVSDTQTVDLRPLASRALQIPGEGAIETLAHALELEARGVDIVHFEIGEPDFATPPHVVQAGIESIQKGRTKYGAAAGTPELRTAVAENLQQTRGLRVDPARILITPGAKPIIFLSVLALIEPGDQVILPDPGFPAYAATVQFTGGTPVSLPLRHENGFRADLAELRRLITKSTKLIILNSPANPTGGVLTREDLQGIADLALAHNLWVLSDEIYSELYFGSEPPPSIATFPNMLDRTILASGFSKPYAMTGWRLGYGVFPPALVRPVTNMVINSHTCVPLFIQDAGVAALRGPQDCVHAMRAEYHARRDLVVDALNAIPGIRCTRPEGAFYAFPKLTGSKFANVRSFTRLLLESGVAVLPGTDFGRHGEGFFRLSFATGRERLTEGLRRIRAMAEREL